VADIGTENLRTGTFTGYYDIPPQPLGKGTYQGYANDFKGTVRGHSAFLVGVDGKDAKDAVLRVDLAEKDGFLTLSGSRGGIRLEGKLVTPATPQSPEGGSRPSSVDGTCTPALGDTHGAAWCIALVDDARAQMKGKQPGGTVKVDIKGALNSIACALIAPTGGTSSSCRMTVPAVDANVILRADGSRTISVEYVGDKVFGPSEGSLVLPAQSGPAASSVPGTTLIDDSRQLLDTALQILALQRQEILEIDQQLP